MAVLKPRSGEPFAREWRRLHVPRGLVKLPDRGEMVVNWFFEPLWARRAGRGMVPCLGVDAIMPRGLTVRDWGPVFEMSVERALKSHAFERWLRKLLDEWGVDPRHCGLPVLPSYLECGDA